MVDWPQRMLKYEVNRIREQWLDVDPGILQALADLVTGSQRFQDAERLYWKLDSEVVNMRRFKPVAILAIAPLILGINVSSGPERGLIMDLLAEVAATLLAPTHPIPPGQFELAKNEFLMGYYTYLSALHNAETKSEEIVALDLFTDCGLLAPSLVERCVWHVDRFSSKFGNDEIVAAKASAFR